MSRIRGEKRTRLESAKTLVEILAIIVAGGWAVFEYGYKQFEERQEGVGLHRVNVELHASTSVRGNVAWVLGELKIRNPSRRVVKTSLVSWWWDSLEPPSGKEHTEEIQNSAKVVDLAPGEESFLYQRFVVPLSFESIVVHAHVFSTGDEEGFECRATDAPDGGVEAMKDQPTVCTAKVGSSACAADGCTSQQAEVMVSLPVSDVRHEEARKSDTRRSK
jgi:hypothetical protein